MKKLLLICAVILVLVLAACAPTAPADPADAQSVADFMLTQNEKYVHAKANTGDISPEIRRDTAENGQSPYAVVITCSDSRVPAEHIFDAGIGELFVIRTAGNVIGEYELGSVEYGAEHLGSPLVLVLGHTHCGAVDAALSGGAHGHIETITDEILTAVPLDCEPREAERLNVENSIARILESHIIQELVDENKVQVRGAIYDIETGSVNFLD